MLIKKLTLVLVAVCVLAATGCNEDTAMEFTVETMMMKAGWDMRESFAWTPEVDRYYNFIMSGKVDLDGAKVVEAYIRKEAGHPLIADRFLRVAGMVGFDLNEYNQVIGVEHVNIKLLQVAAQGFRMGLLLN